MASIERDLDQFSNTVNSDIIRHHFAREEYYAMGVTGILRDHRVELIYGEILDMAPIGDPHAALTHPLAVALENLFGDGYCARNQAPIRLGTDAKPTEPQSDVVVVSGTWRDYISRQPVPKDIVLFVEISESNRAVLGIRSGPRPNWLQSCRRGLFLPVPPR